MSSVRFLLPADDCVVAATFCFLVMVSSSSVASALRLLDLVKGVSAAGIEIAEVGARVAGAAGVDSASAATGVEEVAGSAMALRLDLPRVSYFFFTSAFMRWKSGEDDLGADAFETMVIVDGVVRVVE